MLGWAVPTASSGKPGPRSLTVPALFGESERSAQVRVQENGLELRSVAEIRSSEYPIGSVVAQSPQPQSTSAQVALLVNRGESGTTLSWRHIGELNWVYGPTFAP